MSRCHRTLNSLEISRDDVPLDPLVAVLGPTGAGKSELALALAQALRGEIVNCDSIQVYKRLNVGSAKLAPEARRGVPHHLLDIIAPDQELTAGTYGRIARKALSRIRENGRIPIVAGGTGFYLKALLDGLSPAPTRNEALRHRLAAIGQRRPAALHRFLCMHDPVAAGRIHPNDRQKLIRALELILLARRPATQTQSLRRDRLQGFAVLKLGLCPDRAVLYQCLNERSASLFENGLIEETEALLAGGISAHAKALQSLGYKQALAVLEGRLTRDQAVSECQIKTRQYAKRQLTWFRADSEIQWLPGFGWEESIQAQALCLATEFVAAHISVS